MSANYDNAAWFYDRLSRIVYGDAIIRAQVYLLKFINSGDKILIVGGGTGWILEKIAGLRVSGLNITYVEVSKRMMTLSQRRNVGNNVVFINRAAEDIALPNDFDVIITPFLFDNFKKPGFEKIFNHLHNSLKTDGIWLNSSFQLKGKWWQWVLLKSMFLFFKLTCSIEASSLPKIDETFIRKGYNTDTQQTFFNNFIKSAVYRKSDG